MRVVLLAILILAWVPVFSEELATTTETEIEFLLSSVGDSGCSFIRNGKTHSSSDAEAHLRMKYKRGKRYASTTEKFIERLASSSSMSRKPYMIRCGEAAAVPTGDWFFERLKEYRAGDQAAALE
ncbi:MAG: DUF5329 domain-containing protein [Woeseiaceae bacterium]|nr:DUF5329 domain-containing protein [Woeseiaceae bacterium]